MNNHQLIAMAINMLSLVLVISLLAITIDLASIDKHLVQFVNIIAQ